MECVISVYILIGSFIGKDEILLLRIGRKWKDNSSCFH